MRVRRSAKTLGSCFFMSYKDIAVLIPAYKPDDRLNLLIEALIKKGFSRVIAVDDGGGADFSEIFEKSAALGAEVLRHPENRGKGAALKTGIAHVLDTGAAPIVTCDCDGQHTPEDIALIADRLIEKPDALVLGTRNKRLMPPKSKFGNNLTCFLLGVMTGLWIADTQTGLRGLPSGALCDYLALEGERYEYETNMLMEARRARRPVEQVTIDTLYFDDNKGSHFHPIRDGMKIYGLLFQQIGRYLGSSILAGVIDLGLFTLLVYILPARFAVLHTSDRFLASLIAFFLPAKFGVPALLARIGSSLVNYFVNRNLVFKSHAGKRSIFYYYLVVAIVLTCDIQLMKVFGAIGITPVVSKILADGIMFVVSYNVQQRIIFKK